MTRRSAADVERIRGILERECGGADDALQRAEGAVRVHDVLVARLAPLVGSAGVRALVARSLTLTRPEHPCLEDVLVTEVAQPASAAGDQLRACFSKLPPDATTAAATALLGTLVGLLTTFIGEALVSQLLQSAFPVTDQKNQKDTE